MAGLYVSGVKKPYGCTFCPWCRTTYSFCKAANKNISVLEMNKGPDWCPLMEVPDHGDLIERDAVAYKVCEEIPCSECQFNDYPNDSCVLQTNLEKLKVFIPADKEEA